MTVCMILVLATLASTPTFAQDQGLRRVAVFVQGKDDVHSLPKNERKSLEKNLNAQKKRAEKFRKDLEKQFNKEFGKDKTEWPSDAKEQYLAAVVEEVAGDRAFADLDYRSSTQKNVDDSVRDLQRAITGQEQRTYGDSRDHRRRQKLLEKVRLLRLAEGPEQAGLIVEVQSRRSCRQEQTSFLEQFLDAALYGRPLNPRVPSIERYRHTCEIALLLRMAPGSHLDPKQISEIDLNEHTNLDEGWIIRIVRDYDVNVPYWEFEFVTLPLHGQAGYRGAAIHFANMLGQFVEANNATLTNRPAAN